MSAQDENFEHQLKISPVYFARVLSNEKTFEARFNDRDFQKGDFVSLNEYENNNHTGNQIDVQITYVLNGGQYGIKKGYCVFGFKRRYQSK